MVRQISSTWKIRMRRWLFCPCCSRRFSRCCVGHINVWVAVKRGNGWKSTTDPVPYLEVYHSEPVAFTVCLRYTAHSPSLHSRSKVAQWIGCELFVKREWCEYVPCMWRVDSVCLAWKNGDLRFHEVIGEWLSVFVRIIVWRTYCFSNELLYFCNL